MNKLYGQWPHIHSHNVDYLSFPICIFFFKIAFFSLISFNARLKLNWMRFKIENRVKMHWIGRLARYKMHSKWLYFVCTRQIHVVNAIATQLNSIWFLLSANVSASCASPISSTLFVFGSQTYHRRVCAWHFDIVDKYIFIEPHNHLQWIERNSIENQCFVDLKRREPCSEQMRNSYKNCMKKKETKNVHSH